MPTITASSGNPIADRRLLWAESLFDEGDPAGAAELFADCLASLPDWAAGWYRLGEFYEAAGQIEAAERAWAEALRADPADHLGAALRRQLLSRDQPLDQMPSAFVETLFDAYASDFDQSLTRLGYQGPKIVAAEVARGGRARRALDLGCGTGLLGIELHPLVDWLGSYDISAEMLARAEARGLYDLLEKQDLTQLPPPRPEYDLIAAADVVMYIGALDKVMAWIAGALVPGGRLIFTAEAMPGSGFALGEARRYRHSADYLTKILQDVGFDLLDLRPVVLRQDRGQPVTAFLVSARQAQARPSASAA